MYGFILKVLVVTHKAVVSHQVVVPRERGEEINFSLDVVYKRQTRPFVLKLGENMFAR